MGDPGAEPTELSFSGEIFCWRGPSPFHVVRVPADVADELRDVAREVTYGWGMVPVRMTSGRTVWETSLWPKDGGYLVPIKDVVRRDEDVDEGDVLDLRLTVRRRR